jgi:hypothetical protein
VTPPRALSESERAQVAALVAAGDKIRGVILYRTLTGASLPDAKDYVDELAASRTITPEETAAAAEAPTREPDTLEHTAWEVANRVHNRELTDAQAIAALRAAHPGLASDVYRSALSQALFDSR